MAGAIRRRLWVVAGAAAMAAAIFPSAAQPIEQVPEDDRPTVAGLMIQIEGRRMPAGLRARVMGLARVRGVVVVGLDLSVEDWWHLKFPKPVPPSHVRKLMEQLRQLPSIRAVEHNPTIGPA